MVTCDRDMCDRRIALGTMTLAGRIRKTPVKLSRKGRSKCQDWSIKEIRRRWMRDMIESCCIINGKGFQSGGDNDIFGPNETTTVLTEGVLHPLQVIQSLYQFSPFGEPTDDAIDVEEAAFRQIYQELEGIDQWRRVSKLLKNLNVIHLEYSYVEFLNNHETAQLEPEDPWASELFSSTNQPSVISRPIYPRMAHNAYFLCAPIPQ